MWLLIMIVYVGPMSSNDAVAITTQVMGEKRNCEAAGASAAKLLEGTTKILKYTCVLH